jgi:uncharacterized lipoprotein YddW (UPF0748 family)
MRSAASYSALRRCAAAALAATAPVVVLVAVIAVITPGARAFARLHAQDEVRALWVVRTSLSAPTAVATMVDAAGAGGFNTLLVQIRGRADAYYASALEPRAASLAGQPAFDPLAETIVRAHEAGLKVHAWINVNLVAGVNELPSARDHVVYRHPGWLMVPRALAEDLIAVDPRSPQYLGRLARYVRSQPTELEGLYVSPTAEASVDYTAGVVRDIVSRYAIDGVHFDYVRYPNDEFDYSRDALAAFRRSLIPEVPASDARRFDARLAAEPLLYTVAFPESWRAFREARMTALMARLRETVRAVKPATTVSVAVFPSAPEAAERRLQDWPTWLDRGLVDVVCPMAYTADAALFVSQIAAARQIAGRHPIWAGIGAYRLSSSQIVENVQAARRLGAGGVILFSYDSLSNPSHGPDYLTQVARAAFSSQF